LKRTVFYQLLHVEAVVIEKPFFAIKFKRHPLESLAYPSF